MLGVGFYFHKKNTDFDDYFMAGRSLTAPLLVGTLVSTFYGLDTLFGTSEIGYYEGIAAFFAYSVPYTLLYLAMALLAPVFKRVFPEGTTMSEVVYDKYGKKAGALMSIATFVYSTNTMEMMGMGFLFHLTLGIPFWMGTVIGAVVSLLFTWTGGLWGVTMTDFVQFVIMMCSVGLALLFGWDSIGGYDMVVEGLKNYTEGWSNWETFFNPGGGYLTPWTLLAYSVTALAVLCEPAFFQRMFAASTPKEIKKAFLIGVPIWLAFDWAVTFLGIVAAAAVGLGIIPEIEPNEALFAVTGQYLPVGLLGLFVAGVFAASISTADSYFLVAGGVVGYDLYKKLINPKAADKQVQFWTKAGIIISALMSLVLSFVFKRIMGVWTFQATIIVSTALIPVYFGVFSRKPPKIAAGTAAVAFGFFATVFWYALTWGFGTYSDNWETYIIEIGGIEFWQEYGLLMIPPVNLVIYLVVSAIGKKTMEDVKK
jgi:SSS family solute:Na+ symporter